MPDYRAYHLDPAGHIKGRTDSVHETDVDAIADGLRRYAGLRFEVWQGARLVHASAGHGAAGPGPIGPIAG